MPWSASGNFKPAQAPAARTAIVHNPFSTLANIQQSRPVNALYQLGWTLTSPAYVVQLLSMLYPAIAKRLWDVCAEAW